MKKLLLLYFLFSYVGFSQISVSEKPNRKTTEISKETLSRFKKTETIFVLPDIISIDVYKAILEEHWNITSYNFVYYKNFDFKNYLDDKYSFVYLNTSIKTIDKPRSINVYIYATLDVFMLNNEALKNITSKKKKKVKLIFEKNKIQLASISLYPKNELLRSITNLRNNENKLLEVTYSKNTFYDFNAGFFKNGIQKIHNQLKKESPYYLYESDFSPEIKELIHNKLYVPEYLGLKFNGMRETNTGKNVNHIKELFKNYDFDYFIIKSQELSNKIINKEVLYYIKFTRVNTQRFLHITNGQTGEIIYRKHMPGLTYNLFPKHIFNLNTTIRKTIGEDLLLKK